MIVFDRQHGVRSAVAKIVATDGHGSTDLGGEPWPSITIRTTIVTVSISHRRRTFSITVLRADSTVFARFSGSFSPCPEKLSTREGKRIPRVPSTSAIPDL